MRQGEEALDWFERWQRTGWIHLTGCIAFRREAGDLAWARPPSPGPGQTVESSGNHDPDQWDVTLAATLLQHWQDVTSVTVLPTNRALGTALQYSRKGQVDIGGAIHSQEFRALKSYTDHFPLPVLPSNGDITQLADDLRRERHHKIPGLLVVGIGLIAWGESVNDACTRAESFLSLLDYRMEIDLIAG